MSKTMLGSSKERFPLRLVVKNEPRFPLNKFESEPINLETWRKLRETIRNGEDNCLWIMPSVQIWSLNLQGHPLALRITANFKEGFKELNAGNNF